MAANNLVDRKRTPILLMKRSPLFSGVPDGELERFAQFARTDESIPKKHLLYSEGDAIDELIIVRSGALQVVRPGDRSVFRTLRLGDVLGVSMIGGGRHTADVIAAEESSITVFPGRVLRESNQLLQNALKYMGELVGRLSDELYDKNAGLEARVARALLHESGNGKFREVKVTQEALAARVSVRASRVKVNAKLKQLERLGAIRKERNGAIEILDAKLLESAISS